MANSSSEKVIPLRTGEPVAEGTVDSVLTAALPRSPGKPKGYPRPPGAGRKPGTRNKRTVEVEMLLRPTVPAARRRLRAIINDPKADPDTVLTAIRLLFGYVFGKPRERTEISGPDGQPITSRSRVESSAADVHEAARAIHAVAMLAGKTPVTP